MTDDAESPAGIATLRAQLAHQEAQLQQLRDEIAALIRHDPLTGVMNRRTLHEWLSAELIRSHRTGHPFSYAVVDLDRFDALNRRHGAAACDKVLTVFADAAIRLLRSLDRFGRIENDTFGIVLPATWLDSGVIALARLRAAVDACPWQSIVPGSAVTFSAGLTTNAPGDTPEKLVDRAFKGLMQAREAGGNQTITIEDALPDIPLPED